MHHLRPEHFEVRENGAPVPIVAFSPVDIDREHERREGRFLLLVLDDLISAPRLSARIKAIATLFADRMGPKDVMTVVHLNGGSGESSADPERVRRAIARFRPFGASIVPHAHRAEHALTTIGDLAVQLAKVNHRRKAIVCIGSASIFNPTEEGLPGLNTWSESWFKAIQATARGNATVYVIDPVGLGSGRGNGVTGFADETGGMAFVNSNAFESAVAQVWRETGTYYLLGYQAPSSSGGLHSIEVRVNRPGVQVRSRRARG